MRYIVLFEKEPEMVPVREALEPAHLAFLELNRSEICMAGGLRHEHGGAYVGGLWVFDVADRQRAVELIEANPYYQAMPRKYGCWPGARPCLGLMS